MIYFNTCRCVLFVLSLSLSATAETVRGGSQRERQLEEAVVLGDAIKYAILAKTGISTVPTSSITGDIGVSPIAATAITGFSLTAHSAGQHATSTQITGEAHAASYGGQVATTLTSAVSAMETAYTNAAGRTNNNPLRIDLGGGNLGGVFGGPVLANRLTTGVYTFNGDVNIGSSITFDGGDSDVFIIQIAGNLMQVANTRVELAGQAKAENIFWQVAGKVEVAEGANMKGILLVKTDVLFKTGSSLNGRVLAQTACNLQMATIVAP
jgi:hypothetical protein